MWILTYSFSLLMRLPPRCESEMNVDLHTGKKILTAILNGGRIPQRFERCPTLISLQKASRWLRWMACSLMPDVYEKAKQAEDKERSS